MYRAKDDEGPVGAVPEARENHSHEKVSNGFPLANAAAAQGDVEVVAKPGAQTNVPTAPEVLQAVCEEGLAEIDHEVKTEQLSAAARDVAVAAEISVNLPGKSIGSEQHNPEVWRTELAAKRGVHQERAIVRNNAQRGSDCRSAQRKSASSRQRNGPD